MERTTTMDRFDEKIIGYESTKNILRQILDALKRPELYKSKGKTGLVFIKLSFMCLISFRFEL